MHAHVPFDGQGALLGRCVTLRCRLEGMLASVMMFSGVMPREAAMEASTALVAVAVTANTALHGTFWRSSLPALKYADLHTPERETCQSRDPLASI